MIVDQLFVEVTSFGIDICFCVVLGANGRTKVFEAEVWSVHF